MKLDSRDRPGARAVDAQHTTPAFFMALVVLGSVAVAAAHQAVSPEMAELTQIAAVWNGAHIAGDADALDRLWADDLLVSVHGMPTMSKNESLAMLRTQGACSSSSTTSLICVFACTTVRRSSPGACNGRGVWAIVSRRTTGCSPRSTSA